MMEKISLSSLIIRFQPTVSTKRNKGTVVELSRENLYMAAETGVWHCVV
jgi:hypothetical protein